MAKGSCGLDFFRCDNDLEVDAEGLEVALSAPDLVRFGRGNLRKSLVLWYRTFHMLKSCRTAANRATHQLRASAGMAFT
jgi:hypothetical protein